MTLFPLLYSLPAIIAGFITILFISYFLLINFQEKTAIDIGKFFYTPLLFLGVQNAIKCVYLVLLFLNPYSELPEHLEPFRLSLIFCAFCGICVSISSLVVGVRLFLNREYQEIPPRKLSPASQQNARDEINTKDKEDIHKTT